jgi:hypothetical protein
MKEELLTIVAGGQNRDNFFLVISHLPLRNVSLYMEFSLKLFHKLLSLHLM